MDKDMFENTVLALLKASPGIGSVKLRKGLILIDAIYHSFFGKTLTGITYIKHWYGPVPDYEANNELYKMEFNKIKVTQKREGSVKKTAHYAICEPDISLFPNKTAIEIIRNVADFIKTEKAGKLSEITHDAVYHNTPMGGIIPIESVYTIEVETLPWTDEEREDTRQILEEVLANGETDLSQFC